MVDAECKAEVEVLSKLGGDGMSKRCGCTLMGERR